MHFRFNLRILMFAVAVLAIVFGISYYLTKPDYRQHIRRGRQLVGQPLFSSTGNECNQREQCDNGDEYYLYFYSTNGRRHGLVAPYMITVITFPGQEQFFKIEPFDYGRSRAIADPVEGFDVSQKWLRNDGPVEGQDIWQIRHAKSHDDLRTILQRHAFKKTSKS